MEDKDLFSYANSNEVVDEVEGTFDLNAFSSKSMEEEAEKAEQPKKKVSKAKKVFKIILVCFLVCVIGACTVLGGGLLTGEMTDNGTTEALCKELMKEVISVAVVAGVTDHVKVLATESLQNHSFCIAVGETRAIGFRQK